MRNFAIVFGLSIVASASAAIAGPTELVTNGGFESSSYTVNHEFGTIASFSAPQASQGVTGWTGNGGYNLYFIGGTQTTQSAVSRYPGTNERFYPSMNQLSPNGGNFVALDGDTSIQGGISQNVQNFIAGQQYVLSFYWAGGQLASAQGPTTDSLKVQVGNDLSVTTDIISNISTGFVPWMFQKYRFTATSASELLTFLSAGTPNGAPPIALLDGVSITQAVPEPATLCVVTAGLALAGLARRRYRGSKPSARSAA